jgi:OFA family oxalate/formate antiporter-like MFS transporter
LTAAAFGAGSALTVVPTTRLIESAGYQAAFFWFGLGQGAVVLVCAPFLRVPPGFAATAAPAPARLLVVIRQMLRAWHEVVRLPAFLLMYVMMTLVTVGGLMAMAHLASMAKGYGVADVPVSLLGITLAALPFALSLDRVLNGLTRPFFGWVSDHCGRENTMFFAFALEGAAILLLVGYADNPMLFVLLSGLTFFAWGEIYSLFPALCGDVFGPRYASTNYGLLYTAKGTASLLVPLGGLLHEATGSWTPVFAMAAGFDWLTALLALVALKPLVRRLAKSANR